MAYLRTFLSFHLDFFVKNFNHIKGFNLPNSEVVEKKTIGRDAILSKTRLFSKHKAGFWFYTT